MPHYFTMKAFFEHVPVHGFLLFLITVITILSFSWRSCLSVAMVAMAGEQETQNNVSFHCYNTNQNSSMIFQKVTEFQWTNQEQSIIFGAYFYGYFLTQFFGGVISNSISMKWTLALSVTFASLVNIITPLVARTGVTGFAFLRAVLGSLSGIVLACIYVFVGRWIPLKSRSLAASLIDAGIGLGIVLSMVLSGFFSQLNGNTGWPIIFYFFGGVSLLWVPVWLLIFSDYPVDHKYISKAELTILSEGIKDIERSKTSKKISIKWKKLILSPPMWALLFTNFGHNWNVIMLQSYLPTFFSHIQGYPISTNGILSSLPFLVRCVSNIFVGLLSDWVYKKFNPSLTTLRKLFNSISYFGTATFLVAVCLSGCNQMMSEVFLCVAVGFFGVCSAGFCCTYFDIAPEISGVILGIANTFGDISGLLAPLITGYLLGTEDSLMQWNKIFYLGSGILFFTGTVFLFFASAEDQNYTEPAEKTTPTENDSVLTAL